MTRLLINAAAATRTSLGVRRYFDGVMSHLDWPAPIEFRSARAGPAQRMAELSDRGRRDAIYWSPSHRGPLFAYNHVVTVHDCINIEHVYRRDWRLPVVRAVFAQLLDNARLVVCNSSATRASVLRNFPIAPTSAVVVPGPVYFPELAVQGREESNGSAYVLMICNSLPHKNTTLAGQAFARSTAARRNIGLRIVGSMAADGLAACRDAGVAVSIASGVSDAELRALIGGCRFLWSPSLMEGIDLPVAEALSAGANVLCSDISAHREFYDGEVAFFDPLSLAAATDALEQAFERPGTWDRIAKDKSELTFDRVARSYRAIFDRIAAELA